MYTFIQKKNRFLATMLLYVNCRGIALGTAVFCKIIAFDECDRSAIVLSKLKYILSESLIFSRASVTSKLIYLKYYGGFARQPKMHESTCVLMLPDLLRSSSFTKQKCTAMYVCRTRTFFPPHRTSSSSFPFVFLRK